MDAPAAGECPGHHWCWSVLPKRQEAFCRQLLSAFILARQLAMDGGLDLVLSSSLCSFRWTDSGVRQMAVGGSTLSVVR